MRLQRVRRALAWLIYERRHRLDTSTEVRLADLGLDHPERTHYGATGWRTLHYILRRADVSIDDVFLDLGAGKGRAVYLAAQYPFKRVIGVEIAPELAAIARRNVEANRGRLSCKDVQVVTSDVLRYDIPDDVSVVFMFNPFRGSIFAAAMEKIFASLERQPRRLRLIYANPVEEPYLLQTGRARLVREHRSSEGSDPEDSSSRICLYELGF